MFLTPQVEAILKFPVLLVILCCGSYLQPPLHHHYPYHSPSHHPCHLLSTSPTSLLFHQCYIKFWTSLSSVVDNFYIIAVKSGMMQKPSIVKEMLAWIGCSTQEVDERHKIQMGQWRQQCAKNCLCMGLSLGLMEV